MPREHGWTLGDVETVAIELSESAPISVGRSVHGTKWQARYDMHYGLELGLVLSGRMRRYFPGHRADLGPGEAWLVGMWEPHGFKALAVPCETVVLVMLPQTLASTFFEEAPGLDWIAPFACPARSRPKIGRRARAEMIALGERLLSKLSGDPGRRGVWSRLLAMEMLLLMRERWAAPPRRDAPRADSYGRINVALQMVLQNRRLVTAEGAARACRMSRNSFNARFERLMGISFAKFALRHRLSGAASQLVRTGDPVKAVARDWGFTDASHLHRAFVKHYGCTPTEYRERALGEQGSGGPSMLSSVSLLAKDRIS